jgi:hypothetical protein
VPKNRAVNRGFVRTPAAAEVFSAGRSSPTKSFSQPKNRLSPALLGPMAEGRQQRQSDLARYLQR